MNPKSKSRFLQKLTITFNCIPKIIEQTISICIFSVIIASGSARSTPIRRGFDCYKMCIEEPSSGLARDIKLEEERKENDEKETRTKIKRRK